MAFRTLDKDGSGTIETAEFKHLMTHIGEQPMVFLGLFMMMVVVMASYTRRCAHRRGGHDADQRSR